MFAISYDIEATQAQQEQVRDVLRNMDSIACKETCMW